MNFIKEHFNLILLTMILLLVAIFRDAFIFRIIANIELNRIDEKGFTKICFWLLIIGGLIVRWGMILNDELSFGKRKSKTD